MRPSTKGTYLALTVTVRATSREQLDNLYRALSSHPMVKVGAVETRSACVFIVRQSARR